ncbi:unnamed protein product [Linum tenue]|uniref:Uncharacterized protein n=1 Tax=Linum tenue TaxID=586396 RepID=A0AAV0MYD4_9ROSI|nr:unnamed protein product [Linum tenue]
MGAGGSPPRH